jgi:hypothetical protein
MDLVTYVLDESSLENILQVILPTVGIVLFLFVLLFVLLFLIPSLKLWLKLRGVIHGLVELKKQTTKDRSVVDHQVVAKQIMLDEPLKHLWSEYVETLHDQFEIVDGEERLVNRRATLPAESFFRTEVLVDIPLKTEFFKHLPGLFTGIGIIGTFAGLILGLHDFKPSEDHTEAIRNLSTLLNTVSKAFLVSASAITAAMVATFLEKMAVTAHSKQVEEICQLIDSMYSAGAGEEYLARLVKASEESATQTTQLKDSLVADLREMMTNMVERQIQATQASNQAMAMSITQSIESSLREPMQAISRVVDRTTQNQGEAVQKTLSDIVASFMAKLEDVFGSQITGLNALMQETTSSMRETRDRFAELVTNLSGAGRSAGEAMSQQLTHAMEAAESRQQEMNRQMGQFVEQIRDLVSRSQSETSEQLKATLETFGEKVGHFIDGLSEQQVKVCEQAIQHQRQLSVQSDALVANLGTSVGALISQTSELVTSMRDSVSAMRSITAESVEKMNSGAEKLYVASSDFSKAGQAVATVIERATKVAEQLSAATTGLDAATRTAQLTVAAYEKTRADVTEMMESLSLIVESAKRDAGVSKELVAELEAAAAKFNIVQKNTDIYLDRVSGVLEDTFSKFTDSMRQALDKSRANFDASLAEAVRMLRATIEDLDEGLSKIPLRTN